MNNHNQDCKKNQDQDQEIVLEDKHEMTLSKENLADIQKTVARNLKRIITNLTKR